MTHRADKERRRQERLAAAEEAWRERRARLADHLADFSDVAEALARIGIDPLRLKEFLDGYDP